MGQIPEPCAFYMTRTRKIDAASARSEKGEFTGWAYSVEKLFLDRLPIR